MEPGQAAGEVQVISRVRSSVPPAEVNVGAGTAGPPASRNQTGRRPFVISAGRLTSQTQAAGPGSGAPNGLATTTYAYDGAGHVTSQIDPDGHVTTFTYDILGHKATETDPDTSGGSTVAWLYDAAGRLCRRVVAATTGALPDLTGLANPCTNTISAAAIDTRYGYDSAGNMASATDAISGQVVTATYDGDNRPTAVTNQGGIVGAIDPGTTYGYSSGTNVTRTDPSGSYTFTLDQFGRQIAMSNPLASGGTGDAYAWTYGPSGALASATEPLGAAGTNPWGSITQILNCPGSGMAQIPIFDPHGARQASSRLLAITVAPSGDAQGRNVLHVVLDRGRCVVEIDSTLQVQPEFRRVAEEAAQPQGHLGTHRPALADEFVHGLARNAEGTCKPAHSEPVVGHEVLAQHLAGMNRSPLELIVVGNAHG